jgi:hypothetical protein
MTQKEESLDVDPPTIIEAPRWSLVQYIKEFFLEKYELTIFFQGEVHVQLDGTRIETFTPKTYYAKKIKKLSPKNIVFIDTANIRHVIQVTTPVGYSLKKIY